MGACECGGGGGGGGKEVHSSTKYNINLGFIKLLSVMNGFIKLLSVMNVLN